MHLSNNVDLINTISNLFQRTSFHWIKSILVAKVMINCHFMLMSFHYLKLLKKVIQIIVWQISENNVHLIDTSIKLAIYHKSSMPYSDIGPLQFYIKKSSFLSPLSINLLHVVKK